MLHCLVFLLIYAIVAVLVVYILELILGQLISAPPPIGLLIRCLVALLVLIWFLNCAGLLPLHAAP